MTALIELLHSPHGIAAELLVAFAVHAWRARRDADEDAPLIGRVAVGLVVGFTGLVVTTIAVVGVALALLEVQAR